MPEDIERKFREKINSYHNISNESFFKLFDISSEIKLTKNEILLHQGVVCTHMYFLYSGYMIAYIDNKEGHRYNKNIFTQGDLVTSTVSAIQHKSSNFTLQAITNCILLSLPYKKFKQFILETDDLKSFYISYLEKNWVVEKEKREVSIVLENAGTRYFEFLKQNPDIETYVPLQHIASHLGITPTQLSRIRKNKK
ncbi:MAG: Crp/Fnr family transcriptional regulator [Massilibacteroides sp.]|nr:Crp/Fnr family transcriptional regulator [Massilibacteroides sp.]MDD3061317.1 Crp/Fnr family transcriptional regulator [Massilibacteroides sp.]MDD4114915.1 Crp/Fnr family transcriptional regulator [Massilibacteroides sp.]MDD4659813.1 Crp/Fnr family transcriptional regulator [Massilibacteroides sp.]